MSKQLLLFEEPQNENTFPCEVHQERGIFVATLFGGWYVGHGTTEKSAVEAVKKSFYAEMEMIQ